MGFVFGLLWLVLAGPAWSECLTSLPMPLLEECILSESEGRRYPAQARLRVWQLENGQLVIPAPVIPEDHGVAAIFVGIDNPSPIGVLPARDGTH